MAEKHPGAKEHQTYTDDDRQPGHDAHQKEPPAETIAPTMPNNRANPAVTTKAIQKAFNNRRMMDF